MAPLTASSLVVTAKFSMEDQEIAEDSVAIDMLMIQELMKTVKSLHFDMAELKSGGNGANKSVTQPEPSVKIFFIKS